MALLAAYSFDETGDLVIDQTGNGHDFSISGATSSRTASGHTNGGLTSSTADSATIVTNTPFGQSADRSVMCWMKGIENGYSVRWQVAGIDSGAWGIVTLSGSIGAWGRNAVTNANPSVAPPADAETEWHHYAAVYEESADELRFFIDGTLETFAFLEGPLRTDADHIDICMWGGGVVIDDLRIYDEALDSAAITSLMAAPVLPPNGGGSSEIRLWNGSAWTTALAPRFWNGSSWVVAPNPVLL